ncbi:hypothetical protein, partial [Vibrio sp. VPAP30]|uniref:hypothetical protein n=1 Tax=Vibrio sp. VPAP30 TaxID=1647102 RepID=UPI000659BA88
MKNHYFPSCEDSSGRNLNILRDHLTGHQNLNLFTEMLGDVKSRENMLCQSISVAPSLASKLTLLCESLNTSYDEIFLTAFFVFLATQTGEKDLVIGEQRDRATSIPIRQIIESDLIVSTLLKRINQVRRLLPECADIFSLSKELEVGDSYRHPIYQALFVGVDASLPEQKTLTSLDITLSVQLQHQKIIVEMRCNSILIERETLERFATCYLEVLKGFVANPQQSLAELPCMSPKDEHTLLVEWNQTQCEFPQHLTLHRCFEQQVERTPDAT